MLVDVVGNECMKVFFSENNGFECGGNKSFERKNPQTATLLQYSSLYWLICMTLGSITVKKVVSTINIILFLTVVGKSPYS